MADGLRAADVARDDVASGVTRTMLEYSRMNGRIRKVCASGATTLF
jgi:hypothetical protein